MADNNNVGIPAEGYNPVQRNPMQDPRMRGMAHDNNRGPHEAPQTVEKYYQNPREIPNHPDFPGYPRNVISSVPFNIDESGEIGGSHY